MLENTPSKLNFRIRDLAKAGLGILTTDGGFIIAVQIVSFLISYFGTQTLIQQNLQTFPPLNKTTFLIIIIKMLNLSVIIYRVLGIANGTKYNQATCYIQALKRLPQMILLYLLGNIILLLFTIPIMRILGVITNGTIMQYYNLFVYCTLSLIPCGIFALIYVIEQQQSPLTAIINTYKAFKHRVSIRMLLNLSMLYTLPFCLSTLVAVPNKLIPYTGLMSALWFLFCHVLTVIVYVGSNIQIEKKDSPLKSSKVIVI